MSVTFVSPASTSCRHPRTASRPAPASYACRLLSNGLQAMLFTICWRFFEEKINAMAARRRALEEAKGKEEEEAKAA